MKDQIPFSRNFSSIATIVSIIFIMIIFSAIIVRDPRRDAGRGPTAATEEIGLDSEAAPAIRENGSGDDESDDEIVIPTATYVPARLSHLDPEYFENQTETNGIIIGGTVIAVLIFFSVLILLILERIRDNGVHEK